VTTSASPSRPRRADVTMAYDLGVDVYVALWSPVILPAAQAVVAALAPAAPPGYSTSVPGQVRSCLRYGRLPRTLPSLGLTHQLKCSGGAGPPQASPRSAAMPCHCRSVTRPSMPWSSPSCCSISATQRRPSPRPPGCSPAAAASRQSPGPGTIRWRPTSSGMKRSPRLALHRFPPRRVDAGLDCEDAIGGPLAGAGRPPTRIWLEPLRHQWEPPAYYQFATGSGRNKQRLQQLDAGQDAWLRLSRAGAARWRTWAAG
jgi:hypothetical protein